MRYSSIFIIGFLLCVSDVLAGRHKTFTGNIQDSTYTDAEYGFSAQLPTGANWKATMGKEGELCRLKLVWQNESLRDLKRKFGTKITPNQIEIWAVKDISSSGALIDTLLNDSSKTSLHNAYIKAINFNPANPTFKGIQHSKSDKADVAGRPAQIWSGVYRNVVRIGSMEANSDTSVRLAAVECDGFVLLVVASSIDDGNDVPAVTDRVLNTLSIGGEKTAD